MHAVCCLYVPVCPHKNPEFIGRMCKPTDRRVYQQPPPCLDEEDTRSQCRRRSSSQQSLPPSSSQTAMFKEKQHLYKYAKQFALLTIVTAYLGNHAPNVDGDLIHNNDASSGFLLGIGLYDYLAFPRLSYSKVLVSLLCMYFILEKCCHLVRLYTTNLQRATSQAIQRVTSSQAMCRIRSTVSSAASIRLHTSKGNNNSGSFNNSKSMSSIVLAAAEPFVSVDIMSKMTMRDVAHVFAYCTQMNQIGFDRTQFLSQTRPVTRQAIQALDAAIAQSRGGLVVVPLPTPSGSSSDCMDALAFAAAARVFAEWRTLRIVPPGYPKFGFGMTLARRDLIQNVRKIEQAVQDWIGFHQGVLVAAGGGPRHDEGSEHIQATTSPTVRQLLRHEVEVNLHPELPALSEHSAASAVLWTNRQLQYQTLAMDSSFRVPVDFPSPKAAYCSAYEKVYGKYHGFLVKTIFQSTFNSAPPAKDILHHMNMPYLEDADTSRARSSRSRTTTSSSSSSGSSSSDHSSKAMPNNKGDDDDEGEIWVHIPIDQDELGDSSDSFPAPPHITESPPPPQNAAYEYQSTEEEMKEHDLDVGDRILQLFSSIFGHCVVGLHNAKRHNSRNAMASFHMNQHSSSSAAVLTTARSKGDDNRSRSNNDNKKAAEALMERNDLPYYLSVLRSLEGGLDKLIAELNMNDPTRV